MRRLARDERADLAAFLMTLSPQQWQAPTLRARWPVRGVVAHVISDDELDPRSLLACVVQGRSRPDRVNAAALARYSTRSPGQLLALLTDHLQPHGLPAALGGRVALVEGVIHRQVIRRARTAWRHPARTAAARAGVGADRPGHRRVVAYPRAAPGRHRSQLFRRSRAGGAGRGRGAAGGHRLIVLLRWTMAESRPRAATCGLADRHFRGTLWPARVATVGRRPPVPAHMGSAADPRLPNPLRIVATDEGWTKDMRWKRIAVGAVTVAVAGWLATPGVSSASSPNSAIPRYQHIVEIMMENTSYATIIGNPLAPQINALADRYGLATNYFGVTHPSEPNYVANIGGSYFGIQDDNQFYCTPELATTDPNCAGTTVDHTVTAQNLAGQLTAAGMTWKGYFQSLPPTPSTVVMTGPNANGPYTFKYPSNAIALYASKHNPFLNFTGTQGALANMVPDTQLAADLAAGKLPDFSLIVPDQCHDMHGTGGCTDTSGLISAGDTYVGNTVRAIMASKSWRQGRNAIVITWDEDDFSDAGQPGTGCCGADPGGGHVVTIVITNKGNKYPLTDNTAYNHYSLLRSYEDAFGLPCLANACDTAGGVKPMTRLFHP